MSASATDSSKHGMDCDRVAREEILEGYLTVRLSEEDRDAFEQHYLGCARCFDALQTLQAIREELRRTGASIEAAPIRSRRPWMAAAGLAAVVVLALAVGVWMRQAPAGSGGRSPDAAARAQLPEEPPAQAPNTSGAPERSFEQLARIEPPTYEPLRLRGVPDEATARFQSGMERYRRRDYAGAADELRSAAALEPDGAHILFFLGLSHLMLSQDAAAVDRLQATIALGDSSYLEEAHWYLAKAFLRRKDAGAARAHLKVLIELRGSRRDEARQLIIQLDKVKD
jgi:hypothetical protein